MKGISQKMALLVLLAGTLMMGSAGACLGEDAQGYFDKGTELLRLGKLDEAIADFTAAINLQTDYAEAYNNRGLAYLRKDDYAAAELNFWMATQYAPSDEKANNNLALAYFKQGKYLQAEKYYKKALSLSTEAKPYHADIYNNLGVIYAKTGMDDGALDAYNNAITIAQMTWVDLSLKKLQYTDAYYNRGNLYYNQGNYEQAIADYTQAIQFYENSEDVAYDFADAYYNRGLCYYNKNDYDNAIADYQKAIQLRPGYTWAYYSKGYAHYMKSEYSQALTDYNTALNLTASNPNHPAVSWIHYGLGLVYKDTGQSTECISSLTTSCNLGNTTACDLLATM